MEAWDKRIEAHQPPPDKRYKDNILNDLNNVMMGMLPIWGSWERFGAGFESATEGMSRQQKVDWVQEQMDKMGSDQWGAENLNEEQGLETGKDFNVWRGKRGEGLAVDENGDLWKGPVDGWKLETLAAPQS
jgi:hypothetical protein